ncbi:ring-hydroxylating oxygenase subunit alpha [Nonomuraea sp. NBC_01738]|uniref:aromatic ring-hydroxylating oxygenase subunit alpha n=1 Tax=Nonomuraea sp. NBC_01738 TaxID=2976003 RepID=UPI002E15E771|nr:ring-hydroxylating oxygenase subunit alpha [Nonomuraea sp. NBC_01738]
MTPDIDHISAGYHPDPAQSMSLHADAYTGQAWFDLDQQAIFARTWQWLCHIEQLRQPGAYLTATIAAMPIMAVRDEHGTLRAFYNVCKHRAHELLTGSGVRRSIICPYHAWNFDLTGRLRRARNTGAMPGFDLATVCLDQIQVTEFAGMIYVNLDPHAPPLHAQTQALETDILTRAPDIAHLTLARRLTYDIASNWKNIIDNFLECYHCHVAHKDFVSLVDMSTYQVTTHGIYSTHMAQAGTGGNTAYDVTGATVTEHAVWWLWPNTCLLRYPGRGNFMVLQIIPDGPGRTRETWDFYLETADPDAAELDSIRYIDEVLQVEDIALVESVQRGMRTPAYTQGKIVYDPAGSGLSEHALHHFHGLVLDAYRHALS